MIREVDQAVGEVCARSAELLEPGPYGVGVPEDCESYRRPRRHRLGDGTGRADADQMAPGGSGHRHRAEGRDL